MPSSGSADSKNSNLKIIAFVAVFLLVAALLFFLYNQNTATETGSNTTTTETTTQTYTSDLGYSITYPNDWTKIQTLGSDTIAGAEIIQLNLGADENRANGKPNLIIYAGEAPVDFCDAGENVVLCSEENENINGVSVKKYINQETGDLYYNFNDKLIIFASPNGDTEAIDEVIKSVKLN